MSTFLLFQFVEFIQLFLGFVIIFNSLIKLSIHVFQSDLILKFINLFSLYASLEMIIYFPLLVSNLLFIYTSVFFKISHLHKCIFQDLSSMISISPTLSIFINRLAESSSLMICPRECFVLFPH